MELRMREFRWHEQFHGIPWNSMELGVRQFRWQLSERQFRWLGQFHGIPWNLECANFADTRSSMEFHGTSSAPISMTRAVPWNSMELWVRQFWWLEQFHGIPWNLEYANFADTRSSMEFNGIPWNLECANFADTSSSMEFHGTWSASISLIRAVLWGAPISMTRAVPWNSMEFHGT